MSDTIIYELTHVQQSSQMDCWAAAIAMLLGRSVGPGRSKLAPGGGFLTTPENLRAFAASYNLKILPKGRSWTTQALVEILALGPILTMGEYSDTFQYFTVWGDNL